MQTFYPDQLIQRPTHAAFPHAELQCGDAVVLHPANGGGPVTSIVQAVIPLFGCITYTSETPSSPAGQGRPYRFRFRLQDVHGAVRAQRTAGADRSRRH